MAAGILFLNFIQPSLFLLYVCDMFLNLEILYF